jgi:hypothetical protein
MGKLFTIIHVNLILRISLTKAYNFNSNVGYLEFHNNLDLEIMFMLPRNQIFRVSNMCQLALVLDE